MPEFVLKQGGGVMAPQAACEYAAGWAAGQGGNVESRFYNFESDFRVESEEDRAECIEYMARNRSYVASHPGEFDLDELAQLDSFVRALKAAPVVGQARDVFPKEPPLDEFTRGYIEAMFFTDSAPRMESDEWRALEAAGKEIPEGNFPSDMGVDDLAPESLADIVSDCAKFQAAALPWLDAAKERGYDAEQAGRDFWFSRNGHGCGFWDRKELRQTPQLVDALGELADAAGNVDSYWGDNSKVYHG